MGENGKKENAGGQGRLIGGKYEILERLGSGGTGSVYRVYDKRLQKSWAAKQIVADRAELEERTLARLNNGVFARIVDVVQEEGFRYLIMDWIDGETLEKRRLRDGPFSGREAAKIGIGLCRAIGTLHNLQPPLLYLDCKPGNVMTDSEGKLRLIDFGSALELCMPEVEPLSASPGYAAPEQLGQGGERRADVRTDVFGVGRTLYALLTGADINRPPYASCPLKSRCPQVEEDLAAIVEKCTAADPGERYQTMEALEKALEDWLAKPCRGLKRRLLCAAGNLAAAGLCAATLWQGLAFFRAVSEGRARVEECLALLLETVLLALTARCWREGQKRRRCPDCEPLLTVLRTEKTPGKWLFCFWLAGLAAAFGSRQPVSAAPEPEKPFLTLRDSRMRKLLVKEGTTLRTAEPVFLELDPDAFFAGEELELLVTARDRAGRLREYRLRYCPEEPEGSNRNLCIAKVGERTYNEKTGKQWEAYQCTEIIPEQ
ncbi:MAG: serine/threonine-protein kinase [Eubacteriales bacterium]|nr:serine/threonine-protein kinase [Eubacteriales bacterium]